MDRGNSIIVGPTKTAHTAFPLHYPLRILGYSGSLRSPARVLKAYDEARLGNWPLIGHIDADLELNRGTEESLRGRGILTKCHPFVLVAVMYT
jgi:hypothetical protein